SNEIRRIATLYIKADINLMRRGRKPAISSLRNGPLEGAVFRVTSPHRTDPKVMQRIVDRTAQFCVTLIERKARQLGVIIPVPRDDVPVSDDRMMDNERTCFSSNWAYLQGVLRFRRSDVGPTTAFRRWPDVGVPTLARRRRSDVGLTLAMRYLYLN
ncbi:unnamed protein product, partial [Nesidiocoris tenuis]